MQSQLHLRVVMHQLVLQRRKLRLFTLTVKVALGAQGCEAHALTDAWRCTSSGQRLVLLWCWSISNSSDAARGTGRPSSAA
eukprot:4403156-Pleurochrysis_carterae.AAC.1